MKNTERLDQKSSGEELDGWTYGSGYKVYIPFRLTSVPTENIHSNRKSQKPCGQEEGQALHGCDIHIATPALRSEGSALGLMLFWYYLEIHRNF